jgi:preprotein translocase subunit SecE
MARQTRAQRRARRKQQEAEGAASLTQRARARQAQIRPQQPVKTQTGRRPREEQRGFRRFLVESWGELKKVEWPSQNHVIQGTVVVLVACVILGVYIWVSDIAFKHFVQQVLLR